MQLTTEEFKLLKKYCKVDYNSEGDLLEICYSWAFHEIASVVMDEPNKYTDWFKSHPLSACTIYPLASYYFENRITYLDRDLSFAPHMVLGTVHKLRGSFE